MTWSSLVNWSLSLETPFLRALDLISCFFHYFSFKTLYYFGLCTVYFREFSLKSYWYNVLMSPLDKWKTTAFSCFFLCDLLLSFSLSLKENMCLKFSQIGFFPSCKRSPQFTLRYQVRYCDWQCSRLRRRRLINFVTSHVTNLWLKLIQLAFFSLLFFGYVKNASRVKQDEVRKQSLFGKNDPLSCVSKLHVFTVCSFIRTFAGLWCPLQEIIYKNPSQFSGMFWINV